jgi:hypothetical protein
MVGSPGGVAFPLAEVLLLLTCATIADCDDFDEIVAWGSHHLDFLRRFAPFHFGIPCARWLRTLVNRLDPLLFGSCFESWIKELSPGRHDLIAVDGKTSRRTHDKRKGLKALHTLSACATNARLVLGQLSVPEKTNEITAIPELLDHLAEAKQLEGALVTIDAMGCQVAIADKIVEHKADYYYCIINSISDCCECGAHSAGICEVCLQSRRPATDRGNRVGDVTLRPDRGRLGVDNRRVGEIF